MLLMSARPFIIPDYAARAGNGAFLRQRVAEMLGGPTNPEDQAVNGRSGNSASEKCCCASACYVSRVLETADVH